MQHRLIEAVDAAVHGLQKAVAMLAFLAWQQAAGQERHDGEADQQRRRHRAQHRHRQASGEPAGAFGQHGERQESKQQHKGAADHRHGDLAGAIDGGLFARLAHAQVAGDVFRHHDAVVHQQAQRDDEARNGQLVEREPAPAQHRHTHGEGQRHRNHDHDARPPAQRQQRDQHQAQRDAEIAAQLPQFAGDVVALVKRHFQLHIGRQQLAIFIGRRHRAIADIEHVEPILLGHRHPHRALAVVTGEMRLFLISPANAGNILHPHDPAIAGAHGLIAHVGDSLVCAASLHVQPGFAGLHGARWQILATTAQGIRDSGDRDADLRHAACIERHPHFRRGQGKHPRRPHARHPDQPLAQVLGDLFQPAVTRRV